MSKSTPHSHRTMHIKNRNKKVAENIYFLNVKTPCFYSTVYCNLRTRNSLCLKILRIRPSTLRKPLKRTMQIYFASIMCNKMKKLAIFPAALTLITLPQRQYGFTDRFLVRHATDVTIFITGNSCVAKL